MLKWLGVAVALVVLPSAARARELSVFVEPAPAVVEAKPLPSGSTPRSLSLAKVGDSIKHGQLWAVVMWGRNCTADSESNWDSAEDGFQRDAASEAAFRDELTALGFNIAGDPDNLFKTEEDNGAELQVGALITDISLMACGGILRKERKLELDKTQAVGASQMSVEWQIYSPVDGRVLAKVPTTARIELKVLQFKIVEDLLRQVFAANVRALAADERFRVTVLSAGPSVSTPRKPAESPPILLPLAPHTPRPLADTAGSVVAVFTGDGMGSAFLVSRDGHLLTNRHVVGAAKYLKVKWSDGAETVGEVVRSDVGRDIALIKTDPRGRQPLSMRRGGVETGETVFAIGTPLDARLQGSLTQGIVSANRILDGYSFIQSDVVVNPGNSGGPLLNAKGEVVGVTVSGVGQKVAPRGINFFIPIDDALSFLSLQVAGPPPVR